MTDNFYPTNKRILTISNKDDYGFEISEREEALNKYKEDNKIE